MDGLVNTLKLVHKMSENFSFILNVFTNISVFIYFIAVQ
jgi:hypothetical protein